MKAGRFGNLPWTHKGVKTNLHIKNLLNYFRDTKYGAENQFEIGICPSKSSKKKTISVKDAIEMTEEEVLNQSIHSYAKIKMIRSEHKFEAILIDLKTMVSEARNILREIKR